MRVVPYVFMPWPIAAGDWVDAHDMYGVEVIFPNGNSYRWVKSIAKGMSGWVSMNGKAPKTIRKDISKGGGIVIAMSCSGPSTLRIGRV